MIKRLAVAQVADRALKMGNVAEPVQVTGGPDEHPHFFTAPSERARDVIAEEPGCACDENHGAEF